MTCGAAARLIAAAVEGGVAPDLLDELVAHIERCAACRHEAETQMIVKRVLASTPEASLPIGMARRLAVRLDREAAGRVAIDWRAWTVRLLPAAACLVLIAAVVQHIVRRSIADDVTVAIAAWGRDEMRSVQSPQINVDGRQLLGVLLMDTPSAAATSSNVDPKVDPKVDQ